MDLESDNASTSFVGGDVVEAIPEEECCEGGSHSDSKTASLSKRAQKRAKRKEYVLANRAQWRKEERQRKKERKAKKRALGVDIGGINRRHLKRPMVDSSCQLRIAIDMAFDHLMSEREIGQCLTQLQYCYSSNRRAKNPLQLHVTSFDGESRKIFDKIQGVSSWDINLNREPYAAVFGDDTPSTSIVYLTSESPNILETLDDGKVYIIGGLVDHNHHKGLCYKLAVDAGIGHAQLPIEQFMELKTRKVLTVNQVFDILLRWTESRDWEEAFFKVIPKRKGALPISMKSDVSNEGDEEDAGGSEKPIESSAEDAPVDVTDNRYDEGQDPRNNNGVQSTAKADSLADAEISADHQGVETTTKSSGVTSGDEPSVDLSENNL